MPPLLRRTRWQGTATASGFAPHACATARGGAYPLRHFRIAGRLPRRNSLQLLPDALLEGGAANIQRQVQADSRSLDEANDLRDELLVLLISTNETGLGKLVLEISGKRIGIITHEDRADSFFGGGDKNGAQRRLRDGKANGVSRAALAILFRLHAEHLRGTCIETAVRVESCLVDGFGHSLPLRQSLLNAVSAMGVRVVFGCQPGGDLEKAVEVSGTHFDSFGELIQAREFVNVRDHSARHGDGFSVLTGESGPPGVTTFAGAETRLF